MPASDHSHCCGDFCAVIGRNIGRTLQESRVSATLVQLVLEAPAEGRALTPSAGVQGQYMLDLINRFRGQSHRGTVLGS